MHATPRPCTPKPHPELQGSHSEVFHRQPKKSSQVRELIGTFPKQSVLQVVLLVCAPRPHTDEHRDQTETCQVQASML